MRNSKTRADAEGKGIIKKKNFHLDVLFCMQSSHRNRQDSRTVLAEHVLLESVQCLRALVNTDVSR